MKRRKLLYDKVIGSTLKFYDIPKIKKNNWKKWLELLTDKQKESVNTIRNSYKLLKNIIPIEVIVPLSLSGVYLMDYPWNYAKTIHQDIFDGEKTFILFIYKLDIDLHLLNVSCQYIVNKNKLDFIEFIKKIYSNMDIVWLGKKKDEFKFIL